MKLYAIPWYALRGASGRVHPPYVEDLNEETQFHKNAVVFGFREIFVLSDVSEV